MLTADLDQQGEREAFAQFSIQKSAVGNFSI
jgi:hypothetical protein